VKIALISLNDSADVHQWSGLNFFIARALEQGGATVHPVGPLETTWTTPMKLRQRWYDAIRRHYHAVLDPRALDSLGSSARAGIPGDADAVLSVTSLVAAAVGRISRPHVSWDDATNASMDEYYPEYRQMAGISQRQSEELGRRAADAVDLAIYASDWAAKSARDAYGSPSERLAVVPFGANLVDLPSDSEIEVAITARPTDVCHLLWVGVDWSRKGGDDAVAVAKLLRAAGINATLTVVGCEPLLTGNKPDWLTARGFVSKATAEGRAELARLFKEAHFFVMPSRAEAYGLVYAEAATYGVPAVAWRTGGIPTIIDDNVTGLLEAEPFDVGRLAQRMLELTNDRSRYERMARAARTRATQRLNWEVAGRDVVQRIERLMRA
jgi:glycosyltransferase involved in cell wall biosynthesis